MGSKFIHPITYSGRMKRTTWSDHCKWSDQFQENAVGSSRFVTSMLYDNHTTSRLQTIALRLSEKALDYQVINDELLVADILKMADTFS